VSPLSDKITRGEIRPLLLKSYRGYPSPIARKKSAKIAFLGGVTPYFLNQTPVGSDRCMPVFNHYQTCHFSSNNINQKTKAAIAVCQSHVDSGFLIIIVSNLLSFYLCCYANYNLFQLLIVLSR
jgi:hypothetical protein